MSTIMNELLAKLRRQKHGQTPLKDVAAALDMKPPYLLKLENGDVQCPSKATLDKIIAYYDCNFSEKELLEAFREMYEKGTLGNDNYARVPRKKFGEGWGIVDGAFRAVYSTKMNFDVVVFPKKFEAGQEIIVTHENLRRLLYWFRAPSSRGVVKKFRDMLRGQPLFLLPADLMLKDARTFGDTSLISTLLLCVDTRLGVIATTDQKEIDQFLKDFEELKEKALPADEALKAFDAVYAEVKEG